MGRPQSLVHRGQIFPGRVENSGMVKTHAFLPRRRCVLTVPGIQSDMVVIATRGDEHGLISIACDNFEAQLSVIKCQRSFQIRDLLMDVTDSRLWRYFIFATHLPLCLFRSGSSVSYEQDKRWQSPGAAFSGPRQAVQ